MIEESSAFGGRSGDFDSPSPVASPTTSPPTKTIQSDSSPTPKVQSVSPATSPQSAASPRGKKEEEEIRKFVDEFGFELSDTEAQEREQHYVRNIDGDRVLRREVKWSNMASNWEVDCVERFEKIKERCRKGVPSKVRGVAWQLLCGSRHDMQNPMNKGVYEALKKKKMDPETEGIIERDLNRTFPTHVMFQDEGDGQAKLRNVLHAYANIDPEVGYVQGMGFLTGTLLTQMEEEEAFWCFHSLMHSEKYRLRDMFKPGFPMLQLFFFQLKALTRKEIPKLQKHFDDLNVDPSFFAAQWFLTLFVYHFQFRALLRIWDIFMCEGWKIIFRAALALMKWEEKMLLSLPFDKILPALKNLHENKNPDEILEKCLKIKFKTEELKELRKQYEQQQKK